MPALISYVTILVALASPICLAKVAAVENTVSIKSATIQSNRKFNSDSRSTNQYPRRLLVEFDSAASRSSIQHLWRAVPGSGEQRRQNLEQQKQIFHQLKQKVITRINLPVGHVLRDYSHLPMSLVRIDNQQQLNDLQQADGVSAVYEDTRMFKHTFESAPLIQQPLANSVLGDTGQATSVVVLDGGADYTHPDLGSCTSPGVPQGCRVILAADLALEDSALDDADRHGTNVSAIVARLTTRTNLIVFDVFDGDSAFASVVIQGINWAIANQANYNIAAINMSLGGTTKFTSTCDNIGTFGNPYTTPLNNALTAGILASVSSGNDGFIDGINSPACVSHAVSVGTVYDSDTGGWNYGICVDSTSFADKVACFSNSARFLDILAPGAFISAGGVNLVGTSQAAPHVAAAIATLRRAYPDASAIDIKTRLTAAGEWVSDPRNGLVFPRLNTWRALGALNNDFEDAYAINALTTPVTINTEDASKETGEPDHAGTPGGKSVWFAFTAEEDGLLQLNTAGSDYDTVLAVYSGTQITGLNSLVFNDDDGSPANTSVVELDVYTGQTYVIAVDDKDAAGGNLTLNSVFAAMPTMVDEEIPLFPVWAYWLMTVLLAAMLCGQQRRAD